MDLLTLLTQGDAPETPNATIVDGVYTNFRCRVLGVESVRGKVVRVRVRMILLGRRADQDLTPHQVRKDGHKIPGEGL